MKKFKVILLLSVLSMSLAGCGSQVKTENNEAELEPEDTVVEMVLFDENQELLNGKHMIAIEVEGYGVIEVELDADTAPITATNFINLIEEGFYDGLTFHRIIDEFMIQGGCPDGTGMGGSDVNIAGEFTQNGYENNISHVRGTISMARSGALNSGSSQFFIMHEDGLYLDGAYAGFGTVTSGMDIVDEIVEDAKPVDGNGSIGSENQPVIQSITIL